MSIPTLDNFNAAQNGTYMVAHVNVPNILGRIRQLALVCFGQILKGLCLQNPCNTYLFIYINPARSNRPLTLSEIETTYYPYIEAFLTVEYFQNGFYELYNVCTDPIYRKRGVMKLLLSTVLKTIPINRTLYLGIDFDNVMIKEVIHLYVSVGFSYYNIGYMPSALSPKVSLILSYTSNNTIVPTINVGSSEGYIWNMIGTYVNQLLVNRVITTVPEHIKQFTIPTIPQPILGNIPSPIIPNIPPQNINMMNTTSFMLIAHGCELSSRIKIPPNVRLIMRCSPTVHYCLLQTKGLFEFAMRRPKNYVDFAKSIMKQNEDWAKNFCVAESGDEINDFNVWSDSLIKTGLFQLPLQVHGYDKSDISSKFGKSVITSNYMSVDKNSMSNLLDIVNTRGGGTILALVCRSPCDANKKNKPNSVELVTLQANISGSGVIQLGASDLTYDIPDVYPISIFNNVPVLYDSVNNKILMNGVEMFIPTNEGIYIGNTLRGSPERQNNKDSYVLARKPPSGTIVFFKQNINGGVVEVNPEQLFFNV